MARTGAKPADDRSARLRERLDMQVATMRGDVRDAVLRLVRELPDHWKKMTGGAQEDAIERIEKLAGLVVDQAVDIVSSRGTDSLIVRLGKIGVGKGMIEGRFTAPYSHEAVAAICQHQEQEVALVTRDADQFKGEKAKAEADNIGDLAIPRGRPLAAVEDEDD